MKSALAIVLGGLTIIGMATNWEDPASDQGSQTATADSVKLTLKIQDAESGLSLEAEKNFPKNTNAFTAMCSLIQVRPENGGFITNLCGVKADGRRRFWALKVDGKSSQVGINSIKLEKDTEILWRTAER